jgi:hypothetical protein
LSEPEKQEERRRIERRRCVFSGNLAYNGLQSSLTGRVHNMSSEGACLVVSQSFDLPEHVEVILSNGLARIPARVVWRSADRLGVKFMSLEPTASKTLPEQLAETLH